MSTYFKKIQRQSEVCANRLLKYDWALSEHIYQDEKIGLPNDS